MLFLTISYVHSHSLRTLTHSQNTNTVTELCSTHDACFSLAGMPPVEKLVLSTMPRAGEDAAQTSWHSTCAFDTQLQLQTRSSNRFSLRTVVAAFLASNVLPQRRWNPKRLRRRRQVPEGPLRRHHQGLLDGSLVDLLQMCGQASNVFLLSLSL